MTRPWMARVLIVLLVGSLLNVLVSGACALWAEPGNVYVHTYLLSPRGWGRSTPADWPETEKSQVSFLRGVGIRYRVSDGYDKVARHTPSTPATWTPTDRYGFVDIQVGWPLYSFEMFRTYARMESADIDGWLINYPYNNLIPHKLPGGLNSRHWLHWFTLPEGSSKLGLPENRPIPTHPLWLGLTLNTLTLGGLPMLAWLGIRRWRAANRRKAGRCGECGYDVGGLAQCPECGTVNPNATEAET